MHLKFDTIEEIQAALEKLRSNSDARRKFPKQIWDSVIRLAQVYSIKEVCQRLKCALTLTCARVSISFLFLRLFDPYNLAENIVIISKTS